MQVNGLERQKDSGNKQITGGRKAKDGVNRRDEPTVQPLGFQDLIISGSTMSSSTLVFLPHPLLGLPFVLNHLSKNKGFTQG